LVANNDAVRDPRQAEGLQAAAISATKYTDNILEALLGELDSVTGETLRVATREGDLRDANPFLSAIGIKVRQGRTPAEEMLDKLDLPRYKANNRSEIAAYDRAFNDVISPMLNQYADRVLSNPDFPKMSKSEQRLEWNRAFTLAKKDIRTYLENADTPNHIDAIRRKAAAVPKAYKKAALKYLQEEEGFDGTIKDMTYPELQAYFNFVDFYKAKFK